MNSRRRRRSAASGAACHCRSAAALFGDQTGNRLPQHSGEPRGTRAAPAAIWPPRKPRTARSAISGTASPRIVSAGAAAAGRSVPPAPDRRSAPTGASASASTRRMPRPRTSISPAIVAGGAHDDDVAAARQLALIVGDKTRPGVNQPQAPDRICRNPTGRAAAPPAPSIATAVAWTQHASAGSRSRLRRQADQEPGAATGPSASRRFSAQMRPRCASTICFEIDRPSPECVPNFSPAGRSL